MDDSDTFALMFSRVKSIRLMCPVVLITITGCNIVVDLVYKPISLAWRVYEDVIYELLMTKLNSNVIVSENKVLYSMKKACMQLIQCSKRG